MKKTIFILLLCIAVFANIISVYGFEENEKVNYYQLNLDSNVQSIKIDCDLYGNGVPKVLDPKRVMNYTATTKNEILYIIHYLNSFNLIDDGKNYMGYDMPVAHIYITQNDGTVNEMGFVSGNYFERKDNIKTLYKTYKTDYKEYQQFIDFIYALKTGQYQFDNDVTFEPSSWANAYMDEAIKDDLVPQKYQINYVGKINRYEFCQLIYNLLDKEKIIDSDIAKVSSPFTDTDDSNIIALYDNQIIKGKSASAFYPYDYITREELATILDNVYKFMDKDNRSKTEYKASYKDKNTFSSWATKSIDNMSSLKVLLGNENNEFCPKSYTTKQEAIVTILKLSKLITPVKAN